MCINHSNNKTSNVKKEIHLVFSSSSHLVNVSNLLPEIILNVCLLTSAIFQRCSDDCQNGCQAQRDHPVPPLDGTASTHDMECAIGVVSRSFYALYHGLAGCWVGSFSRSEVLSYLYLPGVLNRLKLLFPQEIKCLLYNSLIVPHINYCITAWGFIEIESPKFKKKAIRIITASSYISHTEPLFKQLNLLKVEDILTLQELKFYFKYNQGILPKYLQNWNFIPNSKIHNQNTRKITTLHTFKTKHEFATTTKLKYNLPYTINNTPHIVKDKVNTHSCQGFSLYVKQYVINKYNTNCISRNCYICEQNA